MAKIETKREGKSDLPPIYMTHKCAPICTGEIRVREAYGDTLIYECSKGNIECPILQMQMRLGDIEETLEVMREHKANRHVAYTPELLKKLFK